ncbi:MAG: hypothetical protein J6P21_01580 [Clostridia bacterium]|nr:hypothetical protein [Clostridia bacterium]
MKFFSKRKLAVILALCSISSGKNNFTSGLTKPQKAGLITIFSTFGVGALAFGGYKIYKNFNPDDSDDSGKKDDKSKNDKELFSQDEIKKILGDDVPEGEIKNIEDLNKLMNSVTNTLYNSNDCRNICDDWCREIFEKFDKQTNAFEYKKEGNFNVYTYVDEDHTNLEKIKKFMAEKKIPDIFGAAEKLGKKIVPVFQIKVKRTKRIELHFACEDKIDDYLKVSYLVRETALGDL